MALVTEWAVLHQSELLEAWGRREAGQRPNKIDPLR